MAASIAMFKESTKQMRSVLRIPRLCKQFHDKVREGNMDEFKSLDYVYQRHFGL